MHRSTPILHPTTLSCMFVYELYIFIQLTVTYEAMGMFTMVIFLTAHAYVVTFASSPIPKPASGAALLTYIPFIKGGIIAAPPSVLEELYTLGPDAVKTVVDGTSLVIFAGAPLKKAVGNALVTAGMKVVAGYGSFVPQNLCTHHLDFALTKHYQGPKSAQ